MAKQYRTIYHGPWWLLYCCYRCARVICREENVLYAEEFAFDALRIQNESGECKSNVPPSA